MKNVVRTEHKRENTSRTESAPEWIFVERSWTGRGRVRGVVEDSTILVRVNGLTTQARDYKALVSKFFRKDLRLRPNYGAAFCVEIVIETTPTSPRCDVDNVAKSMLDALTGAVYRDDSQVVRLVVERVAGSVERIFVRAQPREGAAALVDDPI